MRSQRRYDAQFVAEAVEHLKRSDRSMKEVADDLGVNVSTLKYWYDRSVAGKKKQRRGAGVLPKAITDAESPEAKIARLERENAALRQKVDSLETDRAILKKAAAFFAKESE